MLKEKSMRDGYEIGVNHIPKELKLQLEIIKRENAGELQAINGEWFTSINWDRFLQLTVHHRIYSLIYSNLKSIDKSLIPSNVFRILQRYFKINTFQMLYLSAEMEQISKLFSENQIPLLILKGPILAMDLYGDISLRTSKDLDVLLPINHLERAHKLLTGLGYIKDENFSTILNEWKWRRHHVTYSHPKKGVEIELHWRLHPGPWKEPTFSELWQRRRAGIITENPVYFLGKEDLFIFLVSHGARHGWSRLRWLIDIDQIIKQGLDWKHLNKLLKKYQSLHLAGQAVFLSSQLLGTSLNEEMSNLALKESSKRLAQGAVFYLESMVNLHTEPIPENVSMHHKRYLFSLKNNFQKIIFILSFMYPYPEDAEVLPLPKHLHFLYFPLRPFLWAWRKNRSRVLS
jgi:hypothetical protein